MTLFKSFINIIVILKNWSSKKFWLAIVVKILAHYLTLCPLTKLTMQLQATDLFMNEKIYAETSNDLLKTSKFFSRTLTYLQLWRVPEQQHIDRDKIWYAWSVIFKAQCIGIKWRNIFRKISSKKTLFSGKEIFRKRKLRKQALH